MLRREKIAFQGVSEELITKDELNLAEYPFTLMARRVPSILVNGVRQPIKTLEYRGWTTINGERRPVSWLVTGSDRFGLPTAGDQDICVAIMEVWREHSFKDRTIPISSAYQLLRKIGLPDKGQNYRRLRAALDRITGTYIVAENAFWDRGRQCYISRRGFHIFESYELIERVVKGQRKPYLPLGHVRASDFFWQSVRDGNLKDLDLLLYRSLPTPLARRLYRYLDKKRYLGASFAIGTYNLALKLGLAQTALAKYKSGKLRQLLTPALAALKERAFLLGYAFERGKAGPKLVVQFARPGRSERAREPLSTEQQLLLDEIMELTGDRYSRNFYRLAVLTLERELVYRALSQTRVALRAGEVRTSAARYFTSLVKRLAAESNVTLAPRPQSNE